MAGSAGSAGRAVKLAVALAMLVSVLAAPAATSSVAAQEEPGGEGVPPEARALVPFSLDMVEGGGILTLRDAEPYEIENPTSISGTIDAPDLEADPPQFGTGAITNGTFSTPVVSFEQEASGLDVYIDAEFSQVSPQNLTGTVDNDGNVFVSAALRVDLDVEVGRPPAITSVCTSSPINLTLSSVEPYDPETGLVTLANGNFTVPPVTSGGSCSSLVAGPINEQLAGSGHAISLTVQGELALPEAEREASATTLAVEPTDGSRIGEPVTMTATVVPGEDADAEQDPTGAVAFRDGGQIIDIVPLGADGTAELVTADLSAGTRALSARYQGDEVFGPSVSATVDHVVSANPALSWRAPATVQIGGAAADLEVTATNTGLGQSLENVRLDVTIQRDVGNAPFGLVGGNPRVTLAQVDGDGAETSVPLSFTGTGANQRYTGSIGAGTGMPLAPGQSLAESLRLALPDVGTPSLTACGNPNRTCPGPARVTFDLQLVDPETGDVELTVASEPGRILMTEAVRRTTTITAGLAPVPPPPAPPIQAGVPAITPHTVRAGNVISLNSVAINPSIANLNAIRRGTMSFAIDGTPVVARNVATPASAGYLMDVPLPQSGDGGSYTIPIPADTEAGTRTLTVRYSGDDFFRPGLGTFTFEVVPNLAPVYECDVSFTTANYVGRANVIAQGTLPATVVAGSEVPISNPEFRMLLDRGVSRFPAGGVGLNDLPGGFTGLDVTYGVDGTTSASGMTRTNETQMDPDPEDVDPEDMDTDPDQVFDFQDLAMSVVVDGEPGEVVPITIESFQINFSGAGSRAFCAPVDGPITLGHVTVAGTTLEVEPGGQVRAGSPVTLSAATAPSVGGVMEFLDGSTTIGVVPVNAAGTASLVTSSLPEGDRTLTARYFGGLTVPSTTSRTVDLTVLARFECAEFTDEGNGAVVRLVYLELLGRCPDAAGYAGWVERLDDGMSPEVFANTIARTNEALGRVVDDGYETMLDRAPDPGGRAFWIGRLGSTGRYDQLLADLASSNEFWVAAGSTNNGFVTLVYERILGRAPDPGGLAHWTGQLNAGVPRGTLVSTLARLDEPLGRIVNGSYAQILSRAPFAGERTSAIAALRATGNRSALYAALIGTSEFFDRAQSFPNPED